MLFSAHVGTERMIIRPLGEEANQPSHELSHFTNRVDELAACQRVLEIPHGQPIPLLMFYGVGGAGKSWLLKRFRQQTLSIPTVYIDLDPSLGGQLWGNSPSRTLAETTLLVHERKVFRDHARLIISI